MKVLDEGKVKTSAHAYKARVCTVVVFTFNFKPILFESKLQFQNTTEF